MKNCLMNNREHNGRIVKGKCMDIGQIVWRII